MGRQRRLPEDDGSRPADGAGPPPDPVGGLEGVAVGSPHEFPVAAYVAAFVVYVALGLAVRSVVLNWIIGPFFLLIVLHLLPRWFGRLRSAVAGGRR